MLADSIIFHDIYSSVLNAHFRLSGRHPSVTVVIYDTSLEEKGKKKKKIKRSSYSSLPNKPGHSCTPASEQLLCKQTTGLLSPRRVCSGHPPSHTMGLGSAMAWQEEPRVKGSSGLWGAAYQQPPVLPMARA